MVIVIELEKNLDWKPQQKNVTEHIVECFECVPRVEECQSVSGFDFAINTT